MDQEIRPWKRLALIFPGQGSHHVGMGQRLADVSRAARDVFRRADEVLETKLSKLCFEGPADELEQTINQQPATFTTSLAWLAAFKERWEGLGRKVDAEVIAGHSLGEFTAAVAAGSLTFEEGLLLVKQRGILMDEAGRDVPGGMASILGLTEAQVLEICAEAAKQGPIGLATANCEGQNAVSGAIAPLERAMELAEKAGARKVVRLPITIASHSPLMAKASEGMAALLHKLPFGDPREPIVGNINADVLETAPALHAELRDQLTAGVRWQKAVERMQSLGADMFIEVGPGNVLTRVIRRIDYNVNSISISDDYDGMLGERFHLVEADAQ